MQTSLTLPLFHSEDSGIVYLLVGPRAHPLANMKTGDIYMLHRNVPAIAENVAVDLNIGWRVELSPETSLDSFCHFALGVSLGLTSINAGPYKCTFLEPSTTLNALGETHAASMDGRTIADLAVETLDAVARYRRGDASVHVAAMAGDRAALLLNLLPEELLQGTLDLKVGVAAELADTTIVTP